MSRLCRLKTASHGDDGKWAYDEIVSLRKQRDELLDELEKAASYHASHECYSEAKRVRAFIASVKGEQ